MDLTGEQWKVLEPLIGELPRWADGRRRPTPAPNHPSRFGDPL
ncbi:MAG TPA: hypothetical protein VF510_24910 [Ktedonobacterales bacterium]